MHLLYVCADPKISTQNNRGYAIHIREFLEGLKQKQVKVTTFIKGDLTPDATNNQRTETARRVDLKAGFKQLFPSKILYSIHDRVKYFNSGKDARFLEHTLPTSVDAIYERYEGTSCLGWHLAQKLNVPFILEINAPFWQDEKYYGRYRSRFAELIDQKILQQAWAIVVVTATIKKYLIEMGIDRDKIHVVPNGVNAETFMPNSNPSELREQLKLTDQIVIGYVGSFSKWHQLDFVVEAASILKAEYSNLRFLLIGQGADQARIQALVRHQRLEQWFSFTGEVPHHQIPPYLSLCEIALLPATEVYCSPIKIFEYMAAQKAILLPQMPGLEPIIQSGITGLFFQKNNLTDFIHQLRQLIQNQELRLRLGENARQRVLTEFTWDKTATKILNLIQNLI